MTSPKNPVNSPRRRLPSAEGVHFDDAGIDDETLESFEFPGSEDSQLRVRSDKWIVRTWHSFSKTLGMGDLAGFQTIWAVVSFSFCLCKIFEVEVFDNVEWWTILVLPLLNTILTGIFDYLMMKWNDPIHVESLVRTRFIILFIIKLTIACWVFEIWLYSEGCSNQGNCRRDEFTNKDVCTCGFIDRHREETKWHKTFCVCKVTTVFVSCTLALIVTELIITTNIINSEQNLYLTTPAHIRIILLVIRPFVWVYNRAMVMFLSFYVFYGMIYVILFGIGFVCDFKCENKSCRNDLEIIGVQFLLIPFSKPYYLATMTEAWQPIQSIKDSELTEFIALTFLVTSFWIDLFNGFFQFSKRFIFAPLFPTYCNLIEADKKRPTNKEMETHFTSHSHNTSNGSMHLIARDNSTHSQGSHQGSALFSPSFPPAGGASAGSGTAGSGSTGNNSGGHGGHGMSASTIVLKDAVSEGYGSYTAQVAQAKAKRLLSNNPLADVLTKQASLSNIIDEDDTITAQTANTPLPQNQGTNGAATNAAMAALTAVGAIVLNKDRLNANNLALDGRTASISDRRVPSMDGSANSANSAISDKSGSRNNNNRPTTPLEAYRRVRENSMKKQRSHSNVEANDRNNNVYFAMDNENTNTTVNSNNYNHQNKTRSRRESSIDTDEDYGTTPVPTSDATDTENNTANTHNNNNNNNNNKNENKSTKRKGRKSKRNIEKEKQKEKSKDKKHKRKSSKKIKNNNGIPDSNADLFDTVVSHDDVTAMNKYEKYAYKRKSKNDDSKWRD